MRASSAITGDRPPLGQGRVARLRIIANSSHPVSLLGSRGRDEVARRHAVQVSLPNPTINTERSSGGHAALVDRFRLTLRRTW